MEADLAFFGLSPDALPSAVIDDGIWPCNLPALRAFLAVDRQWRVASVGMGGVRFLGLDYAGAQAGLALAGIEMTPDLWSDVRVIEAAAVAALNGG